MDPHEPIVLDGLPSDAFDTDFDLDEPHAVGDESSRPAGSSPPPWDAHEEEYDVDYSQQEMEEDHEEYDGEGPDIDSERGEYGEYGEYDGEDEDAFEYVLDDEDELEEGDIEGEFEGDIEGEFEGDIEGEFEGEFEPEFQAGRHSLVDLLAGDQARRVDGRFSDAPSDSLFVDQNQNLLVPLETLLSNARRNHARALDFVSGFHSEVRRGHSLRPLGQDRASLGSSGRGSVGPSRENQRQNHRHHPYGVPQDLARERRWMADQREYRNNGGDGDELVGMEMQPPQAPMRRNRPSPRDQPEVIDLTGEPDSPDLPRIIVPPRARASNASQIPGRNPRRQLSLNQRTPSLSRSDGSLLGNHSNVIDLTLDDSPGPAPPPLPQQLPRRNHHDNPHHHHDHRRRPSARPPTIDFNDQDSEGFGARLAGFVRRFLGPARDVEVQLIGVHGPNMDNPLAGNIPNLNYRGNGHNAAAPPKPDHVPPVAAREGFTRDTGGADDVVVCPSCDQELKYDPDAANEDATAQRPVKKPRNKKDQEEHYFWALKDCGHVYCKNCYESRKVGAKNSSAHFRRDPVASRKLLCAVDDCPTEVNNKLNWVGLFV
ncbi:hypothetical protein C8A00DRAFT_13983 [Chaetomidium leptoderma]|uniref:Cell cycle control protein n=1 Tax=Chaetomidium leptoderma TaxID=669021 RepID=A0AAN6VR68_9PEZI|nr:hypothetical protein C8A00DRAFT_13983 [Chaetomidium leptoderma]